MRFFLRTGACGIASLAVLLQSEGHDVELYSDRPGTEDVLRGIVPRARSRNPEKGSVVIFDGPGLGNEGDRLRAEGFAVIGGNPVDRTLELERGKAMKLFEKQGLTIPETHYFDTLGEGIAFLRKQSGDGKWFFKADENRSTALSRGGDPETLLRFFHYAKTNAFTKQYLKTKFILQKAITRGAEVSTEGFFHYKRGWVRPFNGTLEEKAFLNGGLGEKTGCATNVVFIYNEDEPAIAQRTVIPMASVLEEAKYIGPFDINGIAQRDGTVPVLEASPRFGFDAFDALLMLLRPGTVGEQLEAFAHGELDEFDIRRDALAFTIRVSIPPYPNDNPEECTKKKGEPLDPQLLERPSRVFVHDVMLEEGHGGDYEPMCAGSDCCIAIVGAIGDDLAELRKEVLDYCDHLEIEDKQYRTDPLEKPDAMSAEKRWHALRAAGLLRWGPPDLLEDGQYGAPAEDDDEDDDEPSQLPPPDDDTDAPFMEDL